MVETNYTKIHDGIRAIIENDDLSVYEKCSHIEADYVLSLLDEIDRLKKETGKEIERLKKYELYVNKLEKILNQDE
jgi:hypothetical protein